MMMMMMVIIMMMMISMMMMMLAITRTMMTMTMIFMANSAPDHQNYDNVSSLGYQNDDNVVSKY